MNAIRKQVITALAAAFLVHSTAPVQAQDFWQQLGRALQDPQQSQNRKPQQPPAGNWFNTTPKYREELRPRYREEWRTGPQTGFNTTPDRKTGNSVDSASTSKVKVRVLDGYDRVRVQDGQQLTPNVENIVRDGINAIGSLSEPQQPRRQGTRPPAPPIQTIRRTTPAPSPPTRSVVPSQTPPRNSPAVENTAAKNQDPNQIAAQNLSLTGVAEADARQAVEAAKAGGMLDNGAESRLKTKAAAGDPKAQAALNAWHDVIRGGSRPEDIAKFRETHGGVLDPLLGESLDLRHKLSQYTEDLASGSLTTAGKDQALADIQNSLNKLKAQPGVHPQFQETLSQNIANMHNMNDLGKLAELSGGTPNPLQTMLVGISSTGLPVTVLGDMIGVPVIQAEPVKDAMSPRLTRGAILRNPAENVQTVKYALNSHPCTMGPGERQVLEHQYTLTFDPGDGTSKRYTPSDGVHHWVLDAGRWDIERVTITVTIDNSSSSADFHYLANGKEATVRAGERADHADEFPIEVSFDPGGGSRPCRKLLASGVYTVGVDPARGCFDLYPADERPAVASLDPPAPSPEAAGPSGSSNSRQARIEELLKQMRSRPNAG